MARLRTGISRDNLCNSTQNGHELPKHPGNIGLFKDSERYLQVSVQHEVTLHNTICIVELESAAECAAGTLFRVCV